jgi:hypothetical protein
MQTPWGDFPVSGFFMAKPVAQDGIERVQRALAGGHM